MEYSEEVSLLLTLMLLMNVKATNLQDDFPSVSIDNFKDHLVLVFDLTSIQDATENCHYPELAGVALRLELNFIFPLEQVTEFIVLGERMFSVAVDEFGVVGEKTKLDNVSLQQKIKSIPRIEYLSVPWFFSLCLGFNSRQ